MFDFVINDFVLIAESLLDKSERKRVQTSHGVYALIEIKKDYQFNCLISIIVHTIKESLYQGEEQIHQIYKRIYEAVY